MFLLVASKDMEHFTKTPKLQSNLVSLGDPETHLQLTLVILNTLIAHTLMSGELSKATAPPPLNSYVLDITGGSRLSRIFWEHENLSGLSIIRLIQLL